MAEITTFDTYIASLIGNRPTNEDFEYIEENLLSNGLSRDPTHAPINLYVICDGHGGSTISNYVGKVLARFFMKKSMNYPLAEHYIKLAYRRLQEKIKEKFPVISQECGSTALVVILFEGQFRKKYLQVINLGDCRAVLSKSAMPMCLTKDHKPFWPEEKRRINTAGKKTGHRVDYLDGDWRIIDLSVSRAFGDCSNKFISQDPDMFIYEVSSNDEFVVIGCDGLWDCLQNNEVINFVHDHLTKNYTNYYIINNAYPTKKSLATDDISIKLAEYAIASGSGDNVSVIIFSLK